MVRTLPYRKILMNATVAFFIYGTWAYAANTIGAEKSAVAQGSMSFINTFILAMYLEIIHRISKNFMQLVLYVCACFAVIVGGQAMIHNMVGTQHIFLTLLPGMIIGTVYMVGYLLQLHKKDINI